MHDVHIRVAGQGQAQGGNQVLIDLDGDDPAGGLRQAASERAKAGANLQYPISRAYLGSGDDTIQRGVVDEEVLPQALARAQVEAGQQVADF